MQKLLWIGGQGGARDTSIVYSVCTLLIIYIYIIEIVYIYKIYIYVNKYIFYIYIQNIYYINVLIKNVSSYALKDRRS